MDNSISDMSHLLSVEVEGFKFAVEMGKDAVKFLQRLVAIFSNALKWGMIDKSWRYFKESGPTNFANLRAKHPEGFDALKINKKDYDAFLKFAKKYNLSFMKAPCDDKNSVVVWYGKNDVQLIEHFTNMCKAKLEKEQTKKGMQKMQENQDSMLEKVEAEIVYEPPRTMDLSDYMYDNGFMDCSQEEFDDILRETYGEQCTTLTQFIDNAMEGADPESQKKRNVEISEKCRIEDLSKEAKAGSIVVTFENKRFAGIDKQNHIVFFQMVRKPPRWMGVPADRLIKTKDNNFTAVLNDQSKAMLYDIKFSKNAPNGFYFTPQEQLNTDRVKELVKVFDRDVVDLREYAEKGADLMVNTENRLAKSDDYYTDIDITDMILDDHKYEANKLYDEMISKMKQKGIPKAEREQQGKQVEKNAALIADARLRAGRKR